MRAIIIEEERFTEILSLLKAKCTGQDAFLTLTSRRMGLNDTQVKQLLEEMFRTFNYEFVRWAQSHGASCTK